jgi:glutathione synthetase
MPKPYPPEDLPEATIESIIAHIKDYQANHGSLIKVIGSETEHSVRLHPVGVSVFPTLFPRKLFDEAVELQRIYNKLYCKVAEDVQWLQEVTSPLRDTEPLIDALWTVYEEVQKRRENGSAQFPVQNVSGGVFRSDYMLHWQDDDVDEDEANNNNNNNKNREEENDGLHWMNKVTLKQVEFNSYSCAGGAHANKVADMHRFLVRRHVYHDFPLGEDDMNLQSTRENPIRQDSLPKNKTIDKIAYMLAAALTEYGSSSSSSSSDRQPTAVLMVVQPHNFNTTDERPIEYALWNWEDGGSPIPTYRVEWQDVLRYTTLTETGQLLFHPEEAHGKSIEIGVVYHRAGYEPKEYSSDHGIETRIRLELSRAVKFPSVLGHITTTKKVQQALAAPGRVLERWLTPESAHKIRQTFVKLYPLDDGTPAGVKGVELATNDDSAVDYILKPSLEGGGHNIYGDDIPDFLNTIPRSQWSAYILMERICSPPGVFNVLMSSEGIVAGDVVSELGIFGTCLWRSVPNEDSRRSTCEMIKNKVGGWSFKTKDAFLDEMSVVKGFGCFDTPCLVDQ